MRDGTEEHFIPETKYRNDFAKSYCMGIRRVKRPSGTGWGSAIRMSGVELRNSETEWQMENAVHGSEWARPAMETVITPACDYLAACGRR